MPDLEDQMRTLLSLLRELGYASGPPQIRVLSALTELKMVRRERDQLMRRLAEFDARRAYIIDDDER